MPPAPRTAGRPEIPEAERRSRRLRLNITEGQESAYLTAAAIAKTDVGRWARDILDAAARHALTGQ